MGSTPTTRTIINTPSNGWRERYERSKGGSIPSRGTKNWEVILDGLETAWKAVRLMMNRLRFDSVVSLQETRVTSSWLLLVLALKDKR